MSLRAAVAAVAVLAVTAPAAHAGPVRPSCRVVVDRARDVNRHLSDETPHYDLLSADVASDARTVTAVIRLDTVPTTDPGSPHGVSYEFVWGYGEYDVRVGAVRMSTGTAFGAAARAAGDTEWQQLDTVLLGVFDTGRGEVRVSFELAALRRLTPGAGQRFGGFTVRSMEYRGLVVPWQRGDAFGVGSPVDTASSGASYRLGARSCVTPGR